LTDRERAEVATANASGKKPVVFIHGLWLLAGSWDAWRAKFEDAGFATVAPDWPGDSLTVADGRANPSTFAGKSIQEIADHLIEVVRELTQKPAIIGHSFGGLFTQILAGKGLGAVSVPIDPAPFRGVLPLPISALKAAFPVLGKPGNRKKAVMLTAEQFRFAFTNAVSEEEAAALYEAYPVPGTGKVLFQAAMANFNPGTEAKVDSRNVARGPMKVISGGSDHTVPHAIAHASFKKQKRNPGLTEFQEFAGRGHSLILDSGWKDVADAALAFVQQHTS
jgi:pimeloyl-ACP methyl ester carboxylesterase